MTEKDWVIIYKALISCKEEIDFSSHRFYETTHQKFDKEKVQRALKVLEKYEKPT